MLETFCLIHSIQFTGMNDVKVFFRRQKIHSILYIFKISYPFAAVGINITHLALNLLKAGYLKTHLYNAESRIYTVEDFHKIYGQFRYILLLKL